MKHTYIYLLLLTLLVPTVCNAEDYERKWGMNISVRGVSYNSDVTSKGYYPNDDEGNLFTLAADYYLTQRLALTGGLAFEQEGILTDLDDGIGLKKLNKFGPIAGAKYYFFPKKWIVQPHVGANLYFNFLNLNSEGHGVYSADQGYPGSSVDVAWKAKCPFLTFSPQLGVDVRLISSVSLTLGWEYRAPIGGKVEYDARFINGPLTGQSVHIKDRYSSAFNVGLKVDFPLRDVSDRSFNNLLNLLFIFFSNK